MKTRLILKISRCILIVNFILIQVNVNCQEFAPIGAKWYFPEIYFSSSNVGLVTYESIGDTIINDKLCKTIYKDNGSCYENKGNHYFYEENDSLYYYDESSGLFDLIIDFNAEIGDSWVINKSPGLSIMEGWIVCKVDSISYLNISSEDSLRIQHVTLEGNIDYDEQIITAFYPTKIIEKIGFEIALLPLSWMTLCDGDYEKELRCYEDEEFGLLNFTSEDCLLTPIEEIQIDNEIIVFPNPTKDEIEFKRKDIQINRIEIYRPNGNLVRVIEKKLDEIKLSEIGIYYLKIFTDKGIILKKVVRVM